MEENNVKLYNIGERGRLNEKASVSNVRLWQIADALGIADTTLSKKLRKELPENEKERIFTIIENLSKEAD